MFARLLREPLVHFLGIGLGLFLLYALVSPADSGGERIVISRATLAELAAAHQRTWGRPPTPNELDTLVDARVEEEILYREGRAMGLDQEDSVIKRRVRQKYELIAEEAAREAPSEADLAAYLAANRAAFRAPPVVSFTQILIATDGTAEAVAARAAVVNAALTAGADPAAAGLPTLLPRRIDAMPLDLVARDFGGPFAAALARLPTGQWVGPVVSGYGAHLVRLEARTPAADPALADVRAEVLREWENATRQKARAADLARLRARYEVVIEPAT